MENKANKLFYVGLTMLSLVMLIEMWLYGWNESLFVYSFPFNQMQPFRAHYVTIMICIMSMVLSFSTYKQIGFLNPLILSSLLALLGPSSFELIWHIGRGFGYGVGPEFWLFYLLMVFLCFTYAQWRWTKYMIPIKNAMLYFVLLFGFLVFWLYYDRVFAFYPALLLYDAHLGPNPHTVGFFIFKSIVLLSPLILIKRGEVKC